MAVIKEVISKVQHKGFTVEIVKDSNIKGKYQPRIIVKYEKKEIVSIYPSFNDDAVFFNFSKPVRKTTNPDQEFLSGRMMYEDIFNNEA